MKIIECGHIPEFIIECPYCHTIFTYIKSNVYRVNRFKRKTVRYPYYDTRIIPTYKEYVKEKEDESIRQKQSVESD